MPSFRISDDFKFYMHDGPVAFSFELSGRISDSGARELEQAWTTASSTQQSLIVDLSYVTQVDEVGRRLLRRWFDAGAELVANRASAREIVASITNQPFEVVAHGARARTWRPIHAFFGLALAILSSRASLIVVRLLS